MPEPGGPDPDAPPPGARPDDGIPWRVFLAEAVRRLRDGGVASPETEARRIVERATSTSGAEYALELDEPATERGVGFFDLMLERRLAGEPLQYVIGRWGFRGLDLFVDRRVLIPRPETETVVDHALHALRAAMATGAVAPPVPVVDLGTGSGAIALSVAAEVEGAEVWAVERSPDAAAVARANLAGLGRAATRVRVVEGSWFDPLPLALRGRVGLVVSNPPYVAPDDPLPPEVADWEPRPALVPGPTGFEAVDAVVRGALGWLAPSCALVVELAPDQAERAVALALEVGFGAAEWRPDQAGRPRMLVAHAPDRR